MRKMGPNALPLPGESPPLAHLENVYFILEDRRRPIYGDIISTNMRISFYPNDRAIRNYPQYSRHNRFFNFFDIPIATIKEITTAENRADPLEPESCFFMILCKNFRIVTVCLTNPASNEVSGRPSQAPNALMSSFFAFKDAISKEVEDFNPQEVIDLILLKSDEWCNQHLIDVEVLHKARTADSYIPDFVGARDWDSVIGLFNAEREWKVFVDREHILSGGSCRDSDEFYVEKPAPLASTMLCIGPDFVKAKNKRLIPALKRFIGYKLNEHDRQSRGGENCSDGCTTMFHLSGQNKNGSKNLWNVRFYAHVISMDLSISDWHSMCSAAVDSLPPTWHYSHPVKKTSLITLPTLIKDLVGERDGSISSQRLSLTGEQDAFQLTKRKKIRRDLGHRVSILKDGRSVEVARSLHLVEEVYESFINCLKQRQITFVDLSRFPCTLGELYRSYIHLMAISFSYEDSQKWFQLLYRTKWLLYVGRQLELANYCIDGLVTRLSDVILKGSERDFSLSIACLVQIIQCPFFRTIKGFNELIVREWNGFGGHLWTCRIGNCSDSTTPENEKPAPVFLSFLDCVYQLCEQNPFAFEFSARYLRELWDCATSCYHNTFGFNSLPERMQAWLGRPATNLVFISAFDPSSYLYGSAQTSLLNVFYENPSSPSDPGRLRCLSQQKDMAFWVDMYCRHRWRSQSVDAECDRLAAEKASLMNHLAHIEPRTCLLPAPSCAESTSMTWMSYSLSTHM